MKFSKKFMTDMNEILGPQDWGQYFCESSLIWFDKVHGNAELSYYDGLNSVKNDPDISKKEKLQWTATIKMLQTNLIAIKYNDRYERLNEYKIITPLSTQDFTDLKTAIDVLNSEIKSYYSIDFNAGYIDYAEIIETPESKSIRSLNSFDGIKPNASIQVYSRSGKTHIVSSMDELMKYLNDLIKEDKNTDSWAVYQKIKDIDDGFAAYEKIQ